MFNSLLRDHRRPKLTRDAKRVRARIDGRRIQLLEDVELPPDGEVTISIEVPDQNTAAMLRALDLSAGAWTDENHPELKSPQDVDAYVRGLRSAFQRGYGG